MAAIAGSAEPQLGMSRPWAAPTKGTVALRYRRAHSASGLLHDLLDTPENGLAIAVLDRLDHADLGDAAVTDTALGDRLARAARVKFLLTCFCPIRSLFLYEADAVAEGAAYFVEGFQGRVAGVALDFG